MLPDVRVDVFSELLARGLVSLVEDILLYTDAETVTSCSLVCSNWARNFEQHKIWRHLLEKLFKTDKSFRKLCLLNDWWKLLPSKGLLEMESETSCKRVMQRVTNYDTRYSINNLTSVKLMAGGLFSCLKLHHNLLFAGMLDGLIKMWDVTSMTQGASDLRRPLKLFEGHEESVTCLDAGAGVLVSGSLDRSVRVWSLESSSLLRVLRREGSPIHCVKMLSDRLLWWSRSGAFHISSWRGYTKVETAFKFNINEDPNTCLMCINEHYIVTNQTELNAFNNRDVVVYSSVTGMRLFEKDIFSCKDITCLSLGGHLLFIGSGNTIEVWDVNISSCLAIIQSGNPMSSNITVKDICVSEFQMIAMISNSELMAIPLMLIMREATLSSSEPAIINWNMAAAVLGNRDLAWKNMAMGDQRFCFGLEKKLGDIKLYFWRHEKNSNRTRSYIL